MSPTMRITNVAGPSPVSWLPSAAPQCAQFGTTLRKPENSFPFPHTGQRKVSPARKGEGWGSLASATTAREASLEHRFRRACAGPPVDEAEQEQPHHVDEVPVPRRGFEAEV